MNLSEYTRLLSKPESVNDKQTVALEEIVSEFPFFQSARALRLKGLYNQNSFQYNYALKVTAAYTTDRSVLFDFITSDTFTAIHKGLYEQKLAELYGIEVKAIEPVQIEAVDSGLDKVERTSAGELAKQSILTSIKESEVPFEAETETAGFPKAEEVVSAPIKATETPATTETDEIANIIEPLAVEVPSENPGVSPETSKAEQTTISNTQASEAILEIGKPLEFSKEEKHSFQEWLQLSRVKPIERQEAAVEEISASGPMAATQSESESVNELEDEKAKKKALIDQFIKANPKIPPIKQDSKPTVAEPFKEDTSALMTETLARVYLEQKKYQKAIQAYEILILKYPEKSTFFADRISEVKNLQQNNT